MKNTQKTKALKKVYQKINSMDLIVGIFGEDPVPNGVLG
jgi:hypothetical protein